MPSGTASECCTLDVPDVLSNRRVLGAAFRRDSPERMCPKNRFASLKSNPLFSFVELAPGGGYGVLESTRFSVSISR